MIGVVFSHWLAFCDIGVSSDCHSNTDSFSGSFGDCYVNDSGQDGSMFFSGSRNFSVDEIEVFEQN